MAASAAHTAAFSLCLAADISFLEGEVELEVLGSSNFSHLAPAHEGIKYKESKEQDEIISSVSFLNNSVTRTQERHRKTLKFADSLGSQVREIDKAPDVVYVMCWVELT